MNYEYYKVFYCVGKHKNFTRAAAELYSSQPAVTRVIQNMETELGCRLFVRTKKGVDFTHEGQTLFRYVSVACEQLIKAEEEIGRTVGPDGGTVYIGATVTALHSFLFDFLDEFHKKFPNVRFKIRTDSSDNVIEYLKNGSADLVFVTTPCNVSKSLQLLPIKQFRDVLIAGKAYEHLKGKRLVPAELKNYPMIALAKGMQLRQFVDDVLASYGVVSQPDIELDGADLLVPMVSHNRGLAIVPESITEDALARGDIFAIELDGVLPSRSVCMISDPAHAQSSASRELHRMILTTLKTRK